MAELKALLFDVDGTLADTERDGHRVAFNRAFADAGLPWDWSEDLYGELLAVTGGKERIRYYIDRWQPEFEPPPDLDDFIVRLHRNKTDHFTRLLADGGIPLRPGVKRLLEEARVQGLRLGIATTTTPANVKALLEHALDPAGESWFEVIAAGDVVPEKKPAPDIYVHALRVMGLSAAECIAFEDSENGILSSRGAGLQTIVTVNGYTHAHRFDEALLVLDQLGEPERAFRVIGGGNTAAVNAATCVDVPLLRKLFRS